MVKMEVGMLAKSKTGHDKNRVYVIDRVDAEYVWLVDGVHRTAENPKKKKRRHVQVIHRMPSDSQDWQEDKNVESRCN